jgi:hypothetical protein
MTEYVTITEAARRCGVSSKTIQRAIQAGKLVVRYPHPNRGEIDVSALAPLVHGQLPGHVQTAPEDRLAALEQRVQHLERLVEEALSKQEAQIPQHKGKTRERTTGPLPKHLVSLQAFADHHSVAHTRVQTHVDIGLLPVKRGEWTDRDGTVVTLALDAKGKHAFYQLYHGVPPFLECKMCPHSHLDRSVQTERGNGSLTRKASKANNGLWVDNL